MITIGVFDKIEMMVLKMFFRGGGGNSKNQLGLGH